MSARRDMVRGMSRSLAITMDADLPHRARALDAGAIAQLYGGCLREYQVCRSDYDCCPERINDTGSGSYVLKCIGNTGNNIRLCLFG